MSQTEKKLRLSEVLLVPGSNSTPVQESDNVIALSLSVCMHVCSLSLGYNSQMDLGPSFVK
jgi:hypothetical protein